MIPPGCSNGKLLADHAGGRDRLLNPAVYSKTLLTIHRRPGNAPGLITPNEHWIGQR
jgi:hypothetical protein